MSDADRENSDWERVQALFHAALDLPEPERAAFLTSRCADATVRQQVVAMLNADQRGNSLLDQSLPEAARRVLLDHRPDPTQHRFGPYQLEQLLGEGGMGVVYLGRRADLGSRAAIKILRDAWLSPARKERFASEQRTLAQLDHPAIAKLLDADSLDDGTPWFAMEYVEGLPLTEFCLKQQTSMRGRIGLMRTVCEAVQHAHQHAVIHRDLKPSNILVRPDGAVKLLDFGIAKHLETLDTQVDQTQTGLRLLTPAYASPEQIRGDKVGILTDVYSLGVILYELVVGRLPYDVTSLTPNQLAHQVVEGQPERPSALAKALSARVGGNPWIAGVSRPAWQELDVLCLTAMHKDPARRYRTVDALIRDLDHFLRGEPLEARPDRWGYRFSKFIGRNRTAVTLSAAAAATVIGMASFYTIRLGNARNAAVVAATRAERIQAFIVNLFQAGDDAVAPPDSLRVIELLASGVQEASALEREPQAQADLYEALGGVYQKLGKLDQADSLLRLALDRRTTHLGAAHDDVGRSLVSLGELRIEQSKFDTALALIEAGLASATARYPATHPDVIRAKTALAQALEEKGDYDRAISLLEEITTLERADTQSRERTLHLGQLANVHFYAGHYPAADSINRLLLEENRRRRGPNHPLVAEDLINLGAVKVEEGRYAEAERFYREALRITEAWYGAAHPKTGTALSLVGRAVQYQNRFGEATDFLKRALAIQERAFGPVHLKVANTLNSLGSIAMLENRPADGEPYAVRTVAIYRALYGSDHQFVGVGVNNLADIYFGMGDYAKAEPMYREGLAIFERTLSPTHVNTGIGHLKLGRVLLRRRRFQESINETQRGYDILIGQTDANTSFLRAARRNLVAAYDSLGTPEKAAKYRAELADTATRG